MNNFIFIILISFSFTQYAPYFNGEKAYEYLLKQCSFGPRYPGSEAHIEFKDYLIDYLKKYNDDVIVYQHEITHPYDTTKFFLYNVLSQYNIESNDRILLMAHWDTREIADKDADESKRNTFLFI